MEKTLKQLREVKSLSLRAIERQHILANNVKSLTNTLATIGERLAILENQVAGEVLADEAESAVPIG